MDPLVDEVELLQANPHYTLVHYPDGREMTVATKHLAPKGQLEVVETLPAPEHIPKKTENLPLDTHMSVTPDAEPSSVAEPEPQPELTPVQNVELTPVRNAKPAPVQDAEPVPVRRSQRVHRPVLRLDL